MQYAERDFWYLPSDSQCFMLSLALSFLSLLGIRPEYYASKNIKMEIGISVARILDQSYYTFVKNLLLRQRYSSLFQ